MILVDLRDFLEHPLSGRGYAFWSGIGSGSPLLAGVAVYLRKHNCHVDRCWRLQFHPHPDHGHPVCRKHFPTEAIDGN